MLRNVEAARGVDDDFGVRLTALIPNLRAFARTLCRGRDGAEDLAQESMMIAWKSRASFESGSNLKAWLFVIQRNAHYSAHRRKWREVEWDQDTADKILVAPPVQLASAELADVSRAMVLLPADQREALILVGAGGFTYHEAALLRGCPTGTMKSRVARARIAVASLMKDGALPSACKTSSGAYQRFGRDVAALAVARHAA
jgi:RNA polymerase sigma-70 factor (ECF subfamily)